MNKKQGLIDDIGSNLCKEFELAIPLSQPNQLRQSKKKRSEKELALEFDAALKKFYKAAQDEIGRCRLGIIGRARIVFQLQQRLLKAGYAAPLVKQVLFALLAFVIVGNRQQL